MSTLILIPAKLLFQDISSSNVKIVNRFVDDKKMTYIVAEEYLLIILHILNSNILRKCYRLILLYNFKLFEGYNNQWIVRYTRVTKNTKIHYLN